MTQETCVLCESSIKLGEDVVQQTEKGLLGLQKASRSRFDNTKHFYVGQIIHKSCRQNYCNINITKRDLKRQAIENKTELDQPALRSKKARFDISTDCLFCGLSATGTQKKGNTIYQVRTIGFQSQIQVHCVKRGPGDKWAEAVLGRIRAVNDLPAADAVYHNQCSVNFRTNRGIPKAYRPSSEAESSAVGRPVDARRGEAFIKITEYLEVLEDEQITHEDLCRKMDEFLDSKVHAYREKHMRERLESHFGEDIVITCGQGRGNVVTFRPTAEKILWQFSEAKKEKDSEREKLELFKPQQNFFCLTLKELRQVKTILQNQKFRT